MPEIPHDRSLDSTLSILRDPYRFISQRCREMGSNFFETRLFLQRAICMRGEEAARLLYDTNLFTRSGAAPGAVVKTLFGKGGVQGLDGEAHLRRKRMFMSVMGPDSIGRLRAIMERHLDASMAQWEKRGALVLYDQLQELLYRGASEWVGVPQGDVAKHSNQLAALFDQAASLGVGHLEARLDRIRENHRMASLVREIRSGSVKTPDNSPADIFCLSQEDGHLLDPQVAAVELINLIRPIMAISVYMIFALHALHFNPRCKDRLLEGDEGEVERFVQEVRRFYPFFPLVTALARHDFKLDGREFPQGTRFILDLYGTNHDEGRWKEPHEFRPERFRDWRENAFDFIPQGGGDHDTNHRCAGEWITIEVMKAFVGRMVRGLVWNVPPQDLSIHMARLPALPRSRFIISNVRRQ